MKQFIVTIEDNDDAHDSFDQLLDRADFVVMSAVELSPGAIPLTREEVEALIDLSHDCDGFTYTGKAHTLPNVLDALFGKGGGG